MRARIVWEIGRRSDPSDPSAIGLWWQKGQKGQVKNIYDNILKPHLHPTPISRPLTNVSRPLTNVSSLLMSMSRPLTTVVRDVNE